MSLVSTICFYLQMSGDRAGVESTGTTAVLETFFHVTGQWSPIQHSVLPRKKTRTADAHLVELDGR